MGAASFDDDRSRDFAKPAGERPVLSWIVGVTGVVVLASIVNGTANTGRQGVRAGCEQRYKRYEMLLSYVMKANGFSVQSGIDPIRHRGGAGLCEHGT